MQAELRAARDAILTGQAEAAVAPLADHVAAYPADFEARYWLASALLQAGDGDGATAALEDARTLHGLAVARSLDADLARLRADPEYGAQVASQLYGRGLVAMASVAWSLSLAAGRIDANALVSYGLSLQHQGRVEEASDVFRLAAETFPSPGVHQFLLFPQIFCHGGDARHAAEARAWAELYAQAPAPAPHANQTLAGRRLRIGYVAPNFAGSQLRQFITPVLEHHDPVKMEVTLYPADAATETGWPSWIKVRPIGHLGDIEAAALIRQDGIDVLTDCWGHTAGSRLGVFARRPAPVQNGWINFIQTTGLSQIDHVLHAGSDDPPDTEGLFAETIWPLGPVFTAFRPASGRLPSVGTPAKQAGVVTLGSFNHPAKMSDGVLAAWATLLRNAPETRLLLKYRYFTDPVLQRVTQARFAAHGVAPERLVFAGHTAGEEYYRSFQAVDLMLDGWPAPGSTTTLEALSNGVPVLAMIGERMTLGGFYARSALEACGLPELITRSPEAFVARGLELVSDVEALDALRVRVRPSFESGPFCDEAGFTRTLENAFVAMFERWQRDQAPAARGAA